MPRKTRTKTSANDFEVFESAFRFFIDYWGLQSWHVDVVHKDIPEALDPEQDAYAATVADAEGRAALVYCSVDWHNRPVTIHDLQVGAYHEALELLMMDIRDLCVEAGVEHRRISTEVHRVIRTLEKDMPEEVNNG